MPSSPSYTSLVYRLFLRLILIFSILEVLSFIALTFPVTSYPSYTVSPHNRYSRNTGTYYPSRNEAVPSYFSSSSSAVNYPSWSTSYVSSRRSRRQIARSGYRGSGNRGGIYPEIPTHNRHVGWSTGTSTNNAPGHYANAISSSSSLSSFTGNSDPYSTYQQSPVTSHQPSSPAEEMLSLLPPSSLSSLPLYPAVLSSSPPSTSLPPPTPLPQSFSLPSAALPNSSLSNVSINPCNSSAETYHANYATSSTTLLPYRTFGDYVTSIFPDFGSEENEDPSSSSSLQNSQIDGESILSNELMVSQDSNPFLPPHAGQSELSASSSSFSESSSYPLEHSHSSSLPSPSRPSPLPPSSLPPPSSSLPASSSSLPPPSSSLPPPSSSLPPLSSSLPPPSSSLPPPSSSFSSLSPSHPDTSASRSNGRGVIFVLTPTDPPPPSPTARPTYYPPPLPPVSDFLTASPSFLVTSPRGPDYDPYADEPAENFPDSPYHRYAYSDDPFPNSYSTHSVYEDYGSEYNNRYYHELRIPPRQTYSDVAFRRQRQERLREARRIEELGDDIPVGVLTLRHGRNQGIITSSTTERSS